MAAFMPMSCFSASCRHPLRLTLLRRVPVCHSVSRNASDFLSDQKAKTEVSTDDGEFRKLELIPKKRQRTRTKDKLQVQIQPPRYTKMPVNQDWPSVWPTAHSFKPSAVPLPIRQGYNQKGAPPGKFGNAELMKIPNFLHLTPPAIKKHCEAIKKFCTAWPTNLDSDEKCERHFPIEIISSDYCHSSPSVRDARSRIVTLKVKLKSLKLDEHAHDKLLRLVGDRYNPKTDVLSLVTERCPLKKQNYDYALYLLTALYHESWKVEPWESEKAEADMEKYVWDKSPALTATLQFVSKMKDVVEHMEEVPPSCEWLQSVPTECTAEDISKIESVSTYANAITKLHNEGEDEESLNEYKNAVKRLIGLPVVSAQDIESSV